MRIAVCDDDYHAADHLAAKVKKLSHSNYVLPFDNIDKLYSCIDSGDCFDVIMLDIDWGASVNGMDFAAALYELSPKSKVVFVTGFPEHYSQQIFLGKANLCGFLRKPVSDELLHKLMEKINSDLTDGTGMSDIGKFPAQKKLTVKFNCAVTTIDTSEIYFLESKGHAAYIYTLLELYNCYERLKDLMERLPDNFVFTHQSYIVNMVYIKRIEKNRLFLMNNSVVPVSKSRYSHLRDDYFRYINTWR